VTFLVFSVRSQNGREHSYWSIYWRKRIAIRIIYNSIKSKCYWNFSICSSFFT